MDDVLELLEAPSELAAAAIAAALLLAIGVLVALPVGCLETSCPPQGWPATIAATLTVAVSVALGAAN